jgi:hypothetical protein
LVSSEIIVFIFPLPSKYKTVKIMPELKANKLKKIGYSTIGQEITARIRKERPKIIMTV